MSMLLTRRMLVTGGIATAAGAAGLGAASRYGLIPPDSTSLYGAGETLTYSAQRLLTSGQPLAREFPKSMISKIAPMNGRPPTEASYRQWLTNGFSDWSLQIEGFVAHPMSFGLDALKRLPMESHVTLHSCEEGWSYIAEWTGVRLSTVLDLVQPTPSARYVVFQPMSNPAQRTGVVRIAWDSIDMADALHPQTLLAYGMNGEALSPDHGAPLRLRLARQMGYKNTKYLSKIVITDSLAGFGKGRGSRSAEGGNSWYGGI